jgi:hypothetical protein
MRVALEHDMWGALEMEGSRKGSNARTLVVPDSGDLGTYLNPSRVRFRTPDQAMRGGS